MKNMKFEFFYPKFLKKIIFTVFCTFILTLTNCVKFDPVSSRETPTNSMERAKKNVEEGRGVSVGNIFGKGKGTNYEFSTSNPMWRASLETLDFLPLSVVDYSGGVIITDWYGSGSNDALKITLRFLSNEVRSDSIKVIVHQKKCSTNVNCKINILDSKIRDELLTSIIKKAAILEKKTKKK